MGELSDKYNSILSRIEDMSPVEPRLRAIYTEGKKEHVLMGRDVNGVPFAPLKPSTLKKRRGPGPPLAPYYSSSRVISKYSLAFTWTAAKLLIAASWPMEWIKYHKSGTRHMAKRDPGGFRPVDRQKAMTAIRAWVWKGER